MDPAVITLVTCGEFALLAHNRKWEAGRYSAVAGFVELGETFEQACVREVLEETRVQVRSSSCLPCTPKHSECGNIAPQLYVPYSVLWYAPH